VHQDTRIAVLEGDKVDLMNAIAMLKKKLEADPLSKRVAELEKLGKQSEYIFCMCHFAASCICNFMNSFMF
jgi:hypothetical protein